MDLYKALNKTLSLSFFTRCVNVVTKKHVAKVVWAYSGKGTYAENTISPEEKKTYIYEREIEHLEVSEWKGTEAGESFGESEALNLGCKSFCQNISPLRLTQRKIKQRFVWLPSQSDFSGRRAKSFLESFTVIAICQKNNPIIKWFQHKCPSLSWDFLLYFESCNFPLVSDNLFHCPGCFLPACQQVPSVYLFIYFLTVPIFPTVHLNTRLWKSALLMSQRALLPHLQWCRCL